MLFIPIFNNMGSLDQSIIILEDAVTFRKQSLAHWMHLVTQNVQVIFAVDPTMQGNTWTKRSPGYGCPNHYWTSSVLHFAKETVQAETFLGLPPHVNWFKSGKNRKTGLIREYYSLPLIWWSCFVVQALHRLHLNVSRRKQRFPDGSSSIVSSFMELTTNSFSWNWIS